MKHEYLIDLLKTNKTVIIPNIGAISNNDSPEHKYLFNEYLKFNDGMIVKYISSKEGKTMDEAGDDLDRFTQGFADLLSQGKEVVIPQIGIISVQEGKTVFTCDENVSATAVPPVEKKEEPVVEKKPDPVPEKKPDPVPEKKPEPIVEKKPDPVPEKKPDPVPEKKPEPVVEKKPDPIPEKKVEPIVEKKPEPVAEKKPEKEQKQELKKEKPKKKKRKLVWIILLILLLGGGGTAGFLFKDQLMEMMGMNEATASNEEKKDENVKEETQEEPKEDTVEPSETTEENVAEESTEEISAESTEEVVEAPVVEEVKEPVVKETPKVEAATSSPGNYYIIVGCYSNQSNADNMIAKISSAGMSPVNVGTFNSLIHIAAASASDKEGALQQLNSVRGTFPTAWILKQ